MVAGGAKRRLASIAVVSSTRRATSAIVTAWCSSSAALRFHLHAVAGGHGSSGAKRRAVPGQERSGCGVPGSPGRHERDRHARRQRRRASLIP